MELIFLGSGGGRWTTITQKMKTGGFRIHALKKIHIDPGPGAVANLHDSGISAFDTDAVIVSHSHPDHYADTEILIEAMTRGMTRCGGELLGSESVLVGKDELGPAVSEYHKSKLKRIEVLKPGSKLKLFDMELEALQTKHSDPTAVGIKLITEAGAVTYTSDTEYFDSMSENYADSEVMILNVIRPKNDRIRWHLCTEDAIKIIKDVKPKLAVMSHFGMRMIGLAESEAKRVENETGVKTIPTSDGMRIKVLGA